MSEMDRAAYVVSQSAAAVIEALGMIAEDARAETLGNPRRYQQRDFLQVIERYGIHHNAVVSILPDL